MPNTQVKLDNTITEVRSKQNLSFNWLGSADFGRIVPFHWQELIGTDKVETLKPSIEMQMLPIASPTFGRMDLYVHYFFVPTRLIFKDFRDFSTKTGEGAYATPPYMEPIDFINYYANAGLSDSNYPDSSSTPAEDMPSPRPLFKHWTSFGLPDFFVNTSPAIPFAQVANDKISTLPFRAYNQVWWDFFRDPELVPDSNKSLYLKNTGGRDFSTAYGVTQDIIYIPRQRTIKDAWISELFATNGLSPVDEYTGDRSLNNNNIVTSRDGLHSQTHRKIEALTRMAERMSLSGKRQIDQLFTQFGIKPEYDKLQMCQYIGGAKQSVLVSDITSTANTSGLDGFGTGVGINGSPLGAKAGSGYCTFDELNIDFTATEPGYLLGVFSVMPKLHFVQGLGKEWFRNDRNDFFRRELEHVGQIAVPRKEVGYSAYEHDIATGGGSQADPPKYDIEDNDKTFAFTQPYYEYKRKCDVIAGDFLYYHDDDSNDDADYNINDLAYMQSMGLYVNYPKNRDYTPENMLLPSNKMNRIFYYQGGSLWDDVDDHFHLNIYVQCIINRPMDGYAIPTLETTQVPHAATTPIANSTML